MKLVRRFHSVSIHCAGLLLTTDDSYSMVLKNGLFIANAFLSLLNSTVNLVIYVLVAPKFRRNFIELFFAKSQKFVLHASPSVATCARELSSGSDLVSVSVNST